MKNGFNETAEVWKSNSVETVWKYRNPGCIPFIKASPCALSCPAFIFLIPKGHDRETYLAIELTDV